MNYKLVKLIGTFSILVFTNTTWAKNTSSALALPLANVVVDGDLSDWPNHFSSYPLKYLTAKADAGEDDLRAWFRVAYNAEEQSFYIGLTVVDDSHVVALSNEESTPRRDSVVLYLDLLHERQHGYPVLFTAAEGFREVTRQANKLDKANQTLSLQNVQVAIKRTGKQTNYEWQIELASDFTIGRPIGLDFLVVDPDEDKQGESYALWTEGFGKSINAVRLGELVAISELGRSGTLRGKADVSGALQTNEVKRLHIISQNNPTQWFSVMVDDGGRFETELPVGKYFIEPAYQFTSDLYAESFHLNTRPISLQEKLTVSIKADQVTETSNLKLASRIAPYNLFEEQGVLMKAKIDSKQIDQFVTAAQAYYKIPGVSIALIKDGKLAYHVAKGLSNARTGQPIQDDTLFEAASITKSMFSVLVLRLVEQELLDLDRPLHEYLPFTNIQADPRSKLLTARMVLNHQSGLDNWPFASYYGGPNGYLNGSSVDLMFTPGTDYGYSGAAFNYLGRVVTQLSRQSLSQLFQDQIADPFGLQNTFFTYSQPLRSSSAMGHYHMLPRHKLKVDIDSPASSVITEAKDFSNFVIGLMHEEHLPIKSYQSIYKPQTILESEQKLYDPDLPQGIANGFNVQETPQGKLIGHGGNNGDFDSKFAYMPDRQTGYVIFTNSNLGDEFIRLFELYLLRGRKGLPTELRAQWME